MQRFINRWKRPVKKNFLYIILFVLMMNIFMMFTGGDDCETTTTPPPAPIVITNEQYAKIIDEQNETIALQTDALRLKQARIDYLEGLVPKAPVKVSKYSEKSSQKPNEQPVSQQRQQSPQQPQQHTPAPTVIQKPKKPQAFITLVSDSKYALGALVLYESLRAVGTTKEFVVLVLDNHYVNPVILDLLREKGAIVKESEPITVPLTIQSNVPRWKLAFSKLRIFDETEYSKLVWIDADDIVLQNIDDLFSYPDMSAPPDFNACTQRADRVSSGIMVVEPKSDKFWKLYDFLEESDQAKNIHNDQDLINAVFEKKTILPEEYGPFVERCHCLNAIPMSEAKTGQFNDAKPWDMKWWDSYKSYDTSNCRYRYFLEWVKHFEKATMKSIDSIQEFLL